MTAPQPKHEINFLVSDTKMSGKGFVFSSSVFFFVLPAVFFAITLWLNGILKRYPLDSWPSLILFHNEPGELTFSLYSSSQLKSPSMESFIQASTAENSLSGLAVYSNLTNACQPLVNVNNANIQLHKIALVTLVNETACRLQDLAVNAQNAGYSVLIYFADEMPFSPPNLPTQKELIIPVMKIYYMYIGDTYTVFNKTTVENFFSDADRTNVDILCPECFTPGEDKLNQMENYLERLYYWFLIGPLITLEWLRRTKRICWMSGGQQIDEEQAPENENVAESEIRTMEEVDDKRNS